MVISICVLTPFLLCLLLCTTCLELNMICSSASMKTEIIHNMYARRHTLPLTLHYLVL